jgi:hypothetical protein
MADGGGRTVSGINHHMILQYEQLLFNGPDECFVISSWQVGPANAVLE